MKIRGHILLAAFAVFLMAITGAFIGCGDDETVNPPVVTPPDLPPQSTFVMDFDDFTQYVLWSSNAGDNTEALTKQNWGQSAVRVAFWNIALTVTLAVPVAAFVEAFQHDPMQLEDGSWQWTYSVTVGVEHTCRLVGNVEENEVSWSMYLSKEGEFTDYLWYSGTHNLPATEGEWTVNRGHDQANPFLGIEWHRNVSTATGDLKYTNIIPGDAENGGYIYYGSTTDTDYDRFYNIYNKGQDNLAEIEWNFTDKNGHVKDENFYGDTDWHCWDTNLDDVDCP
ncbi:MAG: hypothetical protein KKG33_01625 [candidate division Zixibacteria bacterium]|nr:hypothetical protein [candidate division Zixibacteria bacterium]MBU1469484.1 hypothetical protein [candidate division Zixibacteria bacterium]MBU2624238.1 hypothetical protein [candidate division Zixibacteria bacterium]